MAKLSVYTLGVSGVIIDPDPLEPSLPPDSLVSCQNLIHDPKSGHGGGLRNRDGLAKFNPTTTGGIILGGAAMIVVGTGGAPDPTSPGTHPPPGGSPGSPSPPGTPGSVPAPPPLFPTPAGKRGLIIGQRGNFTEQVGDTGWFCTSAGMADPVVLPPPVVPGPPGQMEGDLAGGVPNSCWSGFPGIAIVQGFMYYAQSHTTAINAVGAHGGVNSPVLHRTNGLVDESIARIPSSNVLDDNPADHGHGYDYDGQPQPSIVAIVGANNDTVFLSVLDKMHVSTEPTSRDIARVFRYSVTDGNLTEVPLIDPTTDVGFGPGLWLELPFTMAWYVDRLWLGGLGVGGGAVLWKCNPNVDLPAVKYANNSHARFTVLLPFDGYLWVGAQAFDTGGLGAIFHAPLVRFPADDLASPVVSIDPSIAELTARAKNGYVSLVVFRSTIYASYWNGELGVSHIYKFISYGDDSTIDTWSIVHTGAEVLSLFVDNDVLYAIGRTNGGSANLIAFVSTDGTTFTNKTSTLAVGSNKYFMNQLFGFNPAT